MTYEISNRSVKCDSCEERLTDYNAYLKHVTHMHGQKTPSEETVVDWTLITDEDIITKQGGKYLVGSEAINWSPHFDKEAREFLETKYQKGVAHTLSMKKISEAKRFIKAQEGDTNRHYSDLIGKINDVFPKEPQESYTDLYPNTEQRFPQNVYPDEEWFSHQRNKAGITDTTLEKGYFDDPNAVIGSQTKRFSKGGDHGLEYPHNITEPVAKEKLSTSFYGESDSD